jgi:chemotaxis protein methyltransferase CheR
MIDTNEVDRFRDLISGTLGLQFDDAKAGVLADVLRRRADAAGQSSSVYLARMESSVPHAEVTALAEELTVGETYFFRHHEQYRAFDEVALPDRLRFARASGRPLQILSAGCASGEEPYSLAIAVRNHTTIDGSIRVAITGVDINGLMIRKATRGQFSSWVLRDTSPEVQRRWFRAEGRDYVIDETVRTAVRFEVCNLADEHADLWQAESQDIVFCRNVVMYFTPTSAEALVRRLARALRPGGYLFLGHAETLRGLSTDFHLRHTHGTFYYQLRDGRALHPVAGAIAGRRSTAPGRAPALTDLIDGSWVETIRRASERIEALASAPGQEQRLRSPSTPRPTPAWEVGLVLGLLREERFVDALELMNGLPPESGVDREIRLLRAVLLTHCGQLADAECACRELLESDELNAGAHYLLALCREGAGDRSGAVFHDQIASHLDPGFAMAHLHLGVLCRRSEEPLTARRELEQAITLLQREDAARLLLFGGGFSREALVALCRSELLACGGTT